MINVNGVGRLTKDADLRYTPTGKPVASFTVACNRSYRDSQGNQETTYVRCVLWGKISESFAKYGTKGTLISFSGELSSRQYEDQQGNTKYITEVIMDNFAYLETKAVAESRKNNQSNQNNQVPNESFPTDAEAPF